MLEIKNVLDMEAINATTQEKLSQLQSQMKETENELKLLDYMRRFLKWFENLIPTLEELEDDETNIDILKKLIRQTRLEYTHITALIGFEEGLVTSIEIQVMTAREQIVPRIFHEYGHHRNWFHEIYALKDDYPTAYINDSKVKKISLIGKSIESINTWCLHRLYVLDENPKLGR